MFHFFTKKIFLVDYLDNFIDIHNHILPGIDDGAKTIEDSLAMIRAFSQIGITKFIATPHIMQNYYENTPETINTSLERLKQALSSKSDLSGTVIAAAAEHMIDDNFEDLLELQRVMPHSNEYLLIEMSYLQASINFDTAILKTAKSGFFPILAHPERYSFLKHKSSRYNHYKSQGILFQLNLLSLSEFYGKDVFKKAGYLLDEGLIDFVASDIHNIRQLEYLKKIRVTKKRLSAIRPIIDRTIATFY